MTYQSKVPNPFNYRMLPPRLSSHTDFWRNFKLVSNKTELKGDHDFNPHGNFEFETVLLRTRELNRGIILEFLLYII